MSIHYPEHRPQMSDGFFYFLLALFLAVGISWVLTIQKWDGEEKSTTEKAEVQDAK